MAWWGVALIAVLACAGGYILGGAVTGGKWRDYARQLGQRYHRELEAARSKAAKYRDAYLRACARAAGYRAEVMRLGAEGCGPRCTERAMREAEEREADRS